MIRGFGFLFHVLWHNRRGQGDNELWNREVLTDTFVFGPMEDFMNTEQGLSSTAAAQRMLQDGPNEITGDVKHSALRLFLNQFKSPLVVVLIFACVVSIAVGEHFDAIAIFFILVANATIGFFLENKAETAIGALQNLTAPRAKVLRDGEQKLILAREVVKGDLLVFEAGDLIAADTEILKASRLLTNEAILTGESFPVDKAVGDSLYMGTTVVAGTAVGVASATGMQTKLGEIAHLLKTSTPGPTPLQTQLNKVGNILLFVCLGLVAIVMLVGLIKGTPWLELFIFAMSLAVAAVPEGMPAIVTIALALGVQRLTSRKAFVRTLPSVETLGSVSFICTDKTGTLTTGSMRVREVWGDDPQEIVRAATACIDAEISDDGVESGDPTEIAILYAAFDRGIEKKEIENQNPRVSSEPFDAVRRRMSIFRADGVNYVKGAVENIVAICQMDAEKKNLVLRETDKMSSRGLRVLAIATGKKAEEKDLQFLGLLGIADPPRTEVIAAIQEARMAGITTIMITGDHPLTATAVAREIGLLRAGESVESRVHARATPEEKLKLVRDLKSKGAVVAMTGDGVNDAPALKEAHVGIAMGRVGSEVTRQAADLVLADDNYATIIAAIREGRHIFKSIRRAIVYLLTGNFAEVLIVLAAMIMGVPIPLLAAHLLWINLVTDSLPALTLMAEPLSPNTMKVGPRLVTEKILGIPEWRRILVVGAIEAAVIFIGYSYFLRQGGAVEAAQGFVFTTLVLSQLFRSFGARSRERVFWQVGLFSNLWLLAVIALTGFIQVSLHFIPATQMIFKVGPLSLKELSIMVGIALIPVTLMELKKMGKQKLAKPKL